MYYMMSWLWQRIQWELSCPENWNWRCRLWESRLNWLACVGIWVWLSLNEYQSLLVSLTSNKAELGILLDACEDYMLNRKIAEKIISEVIKAVKGWRELATRLGGSKREIDMFAGVLDGLCTVWSKNHNVWWW